MNDAERRQILDHLDDMERQDAEAETLAAVSLVTFVVITVLVIANWDWIRCWMPETPVIERASPVTPELAKGGG